MNQYFTADRLEKDYGLKRSSAIKLLREMEKRGIGEFKVGRKGWPTRLIA